MEYIVHRRFRAKTICGEVNFPFGTVGQCDENLIHVDGSPICVVTSENAHQYFARNDDGKGLLRGKLTQEIQKTLEKNSDRWDKVWKDSLCQKYKRIEHADYWLWNHDFFNADIYDLQYIAKLVGASVS